MLMKMIIDVIFERTHKLINEKEYDSVGFIPATIKREVQIGLTYY